MYFKNINLHLLKNMYVKALQNNMFANNCEHIYLKIYIWKALQNNMFENNKYLLQIYIFQLVVPKKNIKKSD